MPIVVYAAAAAIIASAPLLWWAVAGGRSSPNAAVARNLAGGHSSDLRELALTRSARERAVRPAIAGLSRQARRVTPSALVATLERRLAIAGRPANWPIERVLAAKLVLGGTGALIGGLLVISGPSMGRVLLAGGMTALGYFAPDLRLYSRGIERQREIQLELPDTLDQMTIAVEAGLGFEAAMSRAGQNGDGPLAAELIRTLQEMQVGVSRAQAFRNLSDRTTVADLRSFVHAIIQAETYGVPIADVLRTQAAEMRTKRRQRAEEKAMKIPIKVIFPLILCILPTLFLILLGPAGIRIVRSFAGL